MKNINIYHVKKVKLKRLWYDRGIRLDHAGNYWDIEAALWVNGWVRELRVYRVEGDVTTTNIYHALRKLAGICQATRMTVAFPIPIPPSV